MAPPVSTLAQHENWIKTPYICPNCKHPLYYIADRAGATVWCPWSDCSGIGLNEGGHGATLEKALNALLGKNGYSDYQYDAVASEDSPADDTTTTDTPVVKVGKRGRKSKGQPDPVWSIPVGEFTIKDFCELNNTYAAKATLFLKTVKTLQEVGKRKMTEGRGKPAMVYLNKVA